MAAPDTAKPNIVYILADDMGYGDMGCNNPQCRIPTPHLDRLAAEGMRFTDAHAGSSVCTPSRYNVLTGRYAWRGRLKTGIVWEWDGALIEPDRPTVADLLRDAGYRTACLGKWHLGWDWPTKDGRHPNETLPFGEGKHGRAAFGRTEIDWAGRIGGGPVDRGFDSYFGVDVPNFPPYTWFENDRLVEAPTVEKPDPGMYGHPGLMVPGWSLEAMIPEFTRRAVDTITDAAARRDAGDDQPFFLYYPLTSPHSPVCPNEPFRGKSGIGPYGDFVCEVDWVVGEVMEALDRTGLRENTLLIFTSDNGPEKSTPDDEGVYRRAQRTRHYSQGDLRGIKRDAWEGGHREPFVASWPAVVPAGSVCDQLVGLGDLFATCADITGREIPGGAAEDSVSILPLLRGETHKPVRDFAIHHSMTGRFAVRRGPWVLIDSPTGDDNDEPEWLKTERDYVAHDQPRELYHLGDDLAERVNRYGEEPRVAEELVRILDEAKAAAGPTPQRRAGERLTE